MLTQPCTYLTCRMDGSGAARYGFWNWDGGIPVSSDQKATAPLAPLPRIQHHPSHQELPLRQPPDAGPTLGQQPVDLGLPPPLEGVGFSAAATRRAGDRRELDVADPQRDAALGDAEA